MCAAYSKTQSRLNSVQAIRDSGIAVGGHVCDLENLEARYDVGITDYVLSRIEDLDTPYHDAVARQYVPSVAELDIKPDEEHDPIGDNVYSPVRGLVHRYPDRVLLKISSVCAVYCRYCFRKEMIGAGAAHLSDADFEAVIAYIKAHSEIGEVILTGGDPFVLSARRLQNVIEALNRIEHVNIIRIHTKIPLVQPSKIDSKLLSVFENTDKAVYMVVHVNHVQEMSDEVRQAIRAIRAANISVFSQSVLLKGVNDNAQILEDLFRALGVMHVHPYYLHHLDRAKGTSHFRVSIARGKEIMRDLQGRVSGIMLPKYMFDIPGGHGKIPINDESVCRLRDGVYRVTDYQGCTHLYFENMEECA